jgi:hypothetical protein
VNDATATGIEKLSRAMGIDPSDQKITFWGSTFPAESWPPDEDRASFPVEGVLILLGAAFLLIRPGRRVPAERAGITRWYAAVFWLALLCYVIMVKWQPWGNRLILYLLVLGAPLAGLWLDAILRSMTVAPVAAAGIGRKVPAWVAVAALVVSGGAGWLAVGYGWPRRLVGTGSIFTESTMQARFQRRPQWRADYEWAAAAVRASGAHRIGLVQGENTWEYPWWVLLRGDDIIGLQTLETNLKPPPASSMDAILCVSPLGTCAYYVPKGWQIHLRSDDIGYALPPGK